MAPGNPKGRPPEYYPAYLDLGGRDCLVVGGGPVAERKALSLIAAGAVVRVVSPTLTERLRAEARAGRLRHEAREFLPSDLDGAHLVIAATDSEEDNRRAADAPLVNVVDRPELSSFIVPAAVSRGPLQIAVSTSGASPALARAMRMEIERLYGPEFEEFLKGVAALRALALYEIADPAARRAFLEAMGGQGVLDAVRAGGGPEILARWRRELDRMAGGG